MLNVPTVSINGREYYSSAGPAFPLPLDKVSATTTIHPPKSEILHGAELTKLTAQRRTSRSGWTF